MPARNPAFKRQSLKKEPRCSKGYFGILLETGNHKLPNNDITAFNSSRASAYLCLLILVFLP